MPEYEAEMKFDGPPERRGGFTRARHDRRYAFDVVRGGDLSASDKTRLDDVREYASRLADVIESYTAPGPSQTLAYRALEEACFRASRAILFPGS